MNDNVSLALGGSRSGLGGLPQRLVQDGVVEEAAMLEAMNVARERKTSIVTQLVTSGAAAARDIAVAASNEFGVPLFDLDAVATDLETVRLVNDKLLAKHRVLPIFRRGKRLFLAVAQARHGRPGTPFLAACKASQPQGLVAYKAPQRRSPWALLRQGLPMRATDGASRRSR